MTRLARHHRFRPYVVAALRRHDRRISDLREFGLITVIMFSSPAQHMLFCSVIVLIDRGG
jgi:hypothetical protein